MGKSRLNNPPAGPAEAATPQPPHKRYDYDPHAGPQLIWAGKQEGSRFEVPSVPLHVHERMNPHTVQEVVRRAPEADGAAGQPSLFGSKPENPPPRKALKFYRHPHGWSNRLIAGDPLLVMNPLLEKEAMALRVQMLHLDPPYGIQCGSNF
ncbi:MAG: hypothetical protein ACRD04_06755 [Terriglobales bacterium]